MLNALGARSSSCGCPRGPLAGCPSCRRPRSGLHLLRFALDVPLAFTLFAMGFGHRPDDAAHPLCGAPLRGHVTRPALEQREEEVLNDVFVILLEGSQDGPGFAKKHRTECGGNRADGAPVTLGGAHDQVCEFGLDLRVSVLGIRTIVGIAIRCRVHGGLSVWFGLSIGLGVLPSRAPGNMPEVGRQSGYCQAVLLLRMLSYDSGCGVVGAGAAAGAGALALAGAVGAVAVAGVAGAAWGAVPLTASFCFGPMV